MVQSSEQAHESSCSNVHEIYEYLKICAAAAADANKPWVRVRVFVHLIIIFVMIVYKIREFHALLILYWYHVIRFSNLRLSSCPHCAVIILYHNTPFSYHDINTSNFGIVELNNTDNKLYLRKSKQTKKIEKEKQMKTWTNNREKSEFKIR